MAMDDISDLNNFVDAIQGRAQDAPRLTDETTPEEVAENLSEIAWALDDIEQTIKDARRLIYRMRHHRDH